MSRWKVVPLAALAVGGLAVGGCTTAFWDRPGATRVGLAQDTDACYRRAVDAPFPAALPRGTAKASGGLGDPPPPQLWRQAPSETAFVRFDESLRYDRCMRELGYRPTRPPR
jgi:hypothetical protein